MCYVADMNKTETKEVTRLEEVVTETLCDICGQRIPYDSFHRNVVKSEDTYPGDYAAEAYDVCASCWPRIVALMKTGPRAE